MAQITVNDLTTGTLDGTGAFDSLMRAAKAHIQDEYSKGRLKGTEYSQAYIAIMQAVLERAMLFVMEQQRVDLEAQLTAEKINTEKLQQGLIGAQTALVQAQEFEALANKALIDQKTTNAVTENLILQAQKTKTEKESANIDAQTGLTAAKELETLANKALIDQKVLNAVTEETVLQGQKCKLDAEFDLLQEQKLKAVAETALLGQKKITETAQVSALGVDPDSIIGRQKGLYKAQTDGYARDAEQKAAKMAIDAFIAQLTTVSGTTTSGTGLDNTNIGKIVQKLGEGVGVTVIPT